MIETGDRDKPDPGQAAEPEPETSRPNTAPAYYLGRPAHVWITVMRPRRRQQFLPNNLAEKLALLRHKRINQLAVAPDLILGG